MNPLPHRDSGDVFDAGAPEINEWRDRAHALCARISALSERDPEKDAVYSELFASVGRNCCILSGFEVEVGCNTYIGDDFFCNFYGVFIDLFDIHIGNGVMFGPRVSLITVNHPLNVPERRTGVVSGGPIVIEDDVWIGTGAIILPGVTVGKGAVVAAGAVVTKDVAPYTVVAGVPAMFLRNSDDPRDSL